MTENTKVLGIRLENDKKERLAKYLNRESAEAMLRQIERGEIDLTLKGVVFKRVNNKQEGVNTTIERVSDKNTVTERVNRISEVVNTLDCDNCPYVNDLNMEAFDEVCEFKGIDRQKALDKCVQMLWR